MTAPPARASLGRRTLALSDRLGLLAAVATVAAVLVAVPVFGANLKDFDEGIQLLKASQLNDGHRLYADVWADQPPLHAYLLAGWLRAFEPFAGRAQWPGRLMTLAISAAASASLWRSVRRDLGPGAAVAGIALLLTSGSWLALSGTAMIGLPCVAFAVLAADALVSTRDGGRSVRLLGAGFAGVLLAASLLTKLLTLPVAAVLIGWALLDLRDGPPRDSAAPRPRRRWSSGVGRAVALVASCLAAFGVVAWSSGMLGHLDQVIGTGLDGSDAYAAAGRDWSEFARFGVRHRALLAAAVVGLIWAAWTGRRGAWLPAAWAVASAVTLAGHAPLRYHQFTVIAVALAWLGAYGAEAAAWAATRLFDGFGTPCATLTRSVPAERGREVRVAGDAPDPQHFTPTLRGYAPLERGTRSTRSLVAGTAALLVAAVVVADAVTVRRPPDSSKPGKRGVHYWNAELAFESLDPALLALTSREGAGPSAFFSDVAAYAYLSGRPSPPWLAVVTLKRLRTNRLTDEEVLAALDRAAVTDVYLGRYNGRLGDAVDARLSAEFTETYRLANRVLYRHR